MKQDVSSANSDLPETVIQCVMFLKDYQTLMSGLLALAAALLTCLVIWRSANVSVRHLENEARKVDNRRTHYASVTISRNLQSIATRAKQCVSTVKVVKASNSSISKHTKEKCYIEVPSIMNDWEFVSLFPEEIITDIQNLMRHIDDHNFDIKRAGGSFGDNNFGDSISRRCNTINISSLELRTKFSSFIRGKGLTEPSPYSKK